ncbi:SCP2 sterol-binding domain-containing protein [Brevibacillus sp. AY1]|uniref:SCP2 sterol-binding domain-containing protein n=1 Tax=Brevibacillus sp. AY1 TaxID=2807621 RepID=UPI0024551E51|nr:SCP2 sterol-binding domain-containing protein [Brevibacillus sp. AY1]MDH4617174.1 SCP2 sterol-binding domain-containing protein [Brevibacillus sp. AY1]
MSVEKTITDLLDKINADPKGIQGMSVVYHFQLSGEEAGTYQVKIGNNQATYSKEALEEARCTLELSDENFIKLVQGNMNPTAAFMMGKLKIKGEMGLSFKLQTILQTYQA